MGNVRPEVAAPRVTARVTARGSGLGPAPLAHPAEGSRATAAPSPQRDAVPLAPADLEGIGLDELVSSAEMLTRVDRKYVLRRHEVPALLRGLDPRTRVLEIDGRRAQTYRSCGFDTPDLASFTSAARARRRRFKVRTRTYVDSHLCFLEVKTRGPRGTTVKTRIPHPGGPEAARTLSAEARAWLAATLAERLGMGWACREAFGAAPMRPHWARTDADRTPSAGTGVTGTDLAARLVPVLDSGYVRTTLLLPEGGGRATLDEGLWWQRDGRHLSGEDLVIIETKSASTPSGLDRLLWRAGHRPERISKYATALAALDEDLPANRWARTLTRHF